MKQLKNPQKTGELEIELKESIIIKELDYNLILDLLKVTQQKIKDLFGQ